MSAVSHAPDRLDVFAITRGQATRALAMGRASLDQPTPSEPVAAKGSLPATLAAVVRKPHRLDVFVTGAGNTLRQWPGGGLETQGTEPWVNWPTNHPTNPAGVLRPDSLEELVNIVQEAERLGRSVRAVGTGWSNSDVAVTAGYVVETDLLNAVLTDVLEHELECRGGRPCSSCTSRRASNSTPSSACCSTGVSS